MLPEISRLWTTNPEFWPIYRQIEPKSDPKDIEKQYKDLRPYRMISWVGWLADKQGFLRIEPDEERYVKITFSEPILSQCVTIHSGNQIEEIGYENKNERPKLINHHPAIQWFVKGNSLRDEFKRDLLVLEIVLGNETKPIGPEKFIDLKIVTKAAWDEYTARKIYYDLK